MKDLRAINQNPTVNASGLAGIPRAKRVKAAE